jgi:hypothetical protein
MYIPIIIMCCLAELAKYGDGVVKTKEFDERLLCDRKGEGE